MYTFYDLSLLPWLRSIVSELYVMVVFFIEQGRENARLARLIPG